MEGPWEDPRSGGLRGSVIRVTEVTALFLQRDIDHVPAAFIKRLIGLQHLSAVRIQRDGGIRIISQSQKIVGGDAQDLRDRSHSLQTRMAAALLIKRVGLP